MDSQQEPRYAAAPTSPSATLLAVVVGLSLLGMIPGRLSTAYQPTQDVNRRIRTELEKLTSESDRAFAQLELIAIGKPALEPLRGFAHQAQLVALKSDYESQGPFPPGAEDVPLGYIRFAAQYRFAAQLALEAARQIENP